VLTASSGVPLAYLIQWGICFASSIGCLRQPTLIPTTILRAHVLEHHPSTGTFTRQSPRSPPAKHGRRSDNVVSGCHEPARVTTAPIVRTMILTSNHNDQFST